MSDDHLSAKHSTHPRALSFVSALTTQLSSQYLFLDGSRVFLFLTITTFISLSNRCKRIRHTQHVAKKVQAHDLLPMKGGAAPFYVYIKRSSKQTQPAGTPISSLESEHGPVQPARSSWKSLCFVPLSFFLISIPSSIQRPIQTTS